MPVAFNCLTTACSPFSNRTIMMRLVWVSVNSSGSERYHSAGRLCRRLSAMTQHEIKVLHCRARSAFAEIVQKGYEIDLSGAFRAEHVKLHDVRIAQFFRVETGQGGACFKRYDLNNILAV